MKGLFIPGITAEMFRNGCLEGIETLMAEGEIYDIDYTGWIPVSEPPKDGRNVFLAYGTNNFKSCCIGHYDHSVKIWYEDKNFFATPIYDCKYWCNTPELPDMGDSQFDVDKKGDTDV